MKNKIYLFTRILPIGVILFFASCKKEKDAELPEISFKQGSGYLHQNSVVNRSTVYKVGFVADKTKAKLRVFKVFRSADTGEYLLVFNYTLKESEKEHFEDDYEFSSMNESGTERYKFTIEDFDGNIAEKTIVLTVQ